MTTAKGWRNIAAGPLTPREGTAAVWTGSMVVFVGGDTGPACPLFADCAVSPEPRDEVAAYQPATDSWVELPDAPHPVVDARLWWSGEEVIVIGSGRTMALDPDSGTWRELPDRSRVGDFMVATGDSLVFVSYEQHPGSRPVDWRFDLTTETWSALPRDPFAESYDRSMAWDGERLWLVSMAVENHFEAYEGAASRVAVLEDDTWRVVEETTPPVQYEQDAWWFQDRLVIAPGRPGHLAQVYAPGTGSWTTLETPDERPCQIPPVGAGPEWLSGGGSTLVSLDPEAQTTLPGCPGFTSDYAAGPEIAVWADDKLLIWGSDYERDLTHGALWQPPPPD